MRLETKPVLKLKRLGIMAVMDSGTAGNSLVLKWRLKNVSKEGVRLRDTNLLLDYVIEIVDEEGKPARLTPKGEKMLTASRMLPQIFRVAGARRGDEKANRHYGTL